MNYASNDQLIAVAQSCRYFDSGHNFGKMSTLAEDSSCQQCKNWDGTKCVIDVFDTVLTSLDQT